MAVAADVRVGDGRGLVLTHDKWRPSAGGTIARLAVIVGLLVVVVMIPHWVSSALVNIVARGVSYMLMALSMNILMGYAGQVSLGHSAFVGTGAFAAGYVLTVLELPFVVAVLAAMALGGMIAAVLGAVALRVRGLYLALVTVAYGILAAEALFQIRGLTGGGAGQPAPRPSFAQGDIAYVYFGLGLVAVVWLFDWRLTASKAGRAIRALRDDERVAASWGINVTAFKLLAFVLSGIVAGLAGAYFASIQQIVSSESFGFTLSLTIVLFTVVGGLGSRPGVVQGGALFAALPTLLETAHEHWGACGHALPKVVQGIVGGVIVLSGLAMFLGARHATTGRVSRAVGGLLLAAGGAWMVYTAVAGGWCVFAYLTSALEGAFGALLLVLTLVFFPGGIAEQQSHMIRWLSFGRFREPEHVAVAGGRGGGIGARP
jgi:branched-chain amino acid transport system permease protein